jgi:predicted DNA-binding transcriptional regulator AlpA
MNHNLLNERETAAALKVSKSLLSRWRFRRDGGPDFYRIGERGAVRYAQSELERFLESRREVGRTPAGRQHAA